MKAVVFTLGCKVNEVESQGIMSALSTAGWEVGEKLGYADVYILNTCAVTAEAEKKSRQLIARVKKYNPQAAIYVCGCASRKNAEAFRLKGVSAVFGTSDKNMLAEAVCADFGCARPSFPYPKQTKTRAFVKIQDGCNNFCSYCVIPYLRGREKSRSIDDILGEINSYASPEVVLNGINISSYNCDGKGLEGLIAALSSTKKRVRLGSLECGVITEDFLKSLKSLYDFAPQFHLSLQSGSTSVLKAMNRRYTREEYIGKCALIYKYFPDCAITTDIISGFPTETEEDFLQSLTIIKEVGFARVHAFSFSAREGTAAYKLRPLPQEVKAERIKRLLSAAKEAETQYISRFCGKKLDFIAEEYADGFTTGYTGNYIKIYAAGKLAAGEKYIVVPERPYADGAVAEVCEESAPTEQRP